MLDFVYEWAATLRRLGRPAEAAALFDRAREHNQGALPWPSPAQMPCCDFKRLAEEAAARSRLPSGGLLLPPRDDAPWRDDLAGRHEVALALDRAKQAIRAEVLAWLGRAASEGGSPLDDGFFESPEGHGAEELEGETGAVAARDGRAPPWSELLLYSARTGWDPARCAQLPTTCAALRGLRSIEAPPAPPPPPVKRGPQDDGPPVCCRVEILRLAPRSRITPHTAPTAARLKAHLGIQVPDGAALEVADQRRPWAEDEVLFFDDSFWHQAWNNHSVAPRVLLSVDFWKAPA